MLPPSHETFTHERRSAVRSRRRRRWTELYPKVLCICGVVLERMASPEFAHILPPSWHPYIVAASAAFGVVAIAERFERRHDYRRWLDYCQRHSKVTQITGNPINDK